MPTAHPVRAVAATTAAMLAFAGNSILCRLALMTGSIDPATFTSVRLLSGAAALALFLALSRPQARPLARGSWRSAFMLFLYAAGFSWAYVSLGAATGALILFGFVQATMIAVALYRGDRPRPLEILGWLLAVAGLAALLLPGAGAPSFAGAVLMAAAGIAWGAYSLLGRNEADALAATTGNFLRGALFALPLPVLYLAALQLSVPGLLLAVLSGALTSGAGYVIWYVALRELSSLQAALVQLTVPAIAALAGIVLLGETLTLRLGLSAALILGGVLIAVTGTMRKPP